MENLFKNKLLLAALLILINVISHFMPFERAALAPDDYASLVQSGGMSYSDILRQAFKYPDRPLNRIILMLQAKLAGDNAATGLFLVFLSSATVLLTVFFLLVKLLGDNFSAFIGSMIFCLLPNKLETFHTSIFFNMNMAICVYLLSFLLFIVYTQDFKKILLIASLFMYAAAIFWYEIGFFLPAVIFTYAIVYKKEAIKPSLIFAGISVIYLIYRVTGVFGLVAQGGVSHAISVSMLPANVIDMLHHFFGRYIIRSALYGGYKFFSIEKPWFLTIVIMDFLLLSAAALWFRKRRLIKIDGRLLFLAAVIFVSFAAPILLNGKGGVGGRHLALPSLGVAIFLLWLLERSGRFQGFTFLALLAVALVISQGNAWTQVVACRINAAVYENMKQNKERLIKADSIVIDTRSFADNIPFTLINRDFNVLNTYYGAQAFEDWGLISMAKFVTSNPEKKVYISISSLEKNKGGYLEFTVAKEEGYRSKSKVIQRVSEKEAVVIGFEDVFGGNFVE
ncbi:MAG: hypothetical protein V1933_07060 [Candidatus Omnitrophota bacterium]